MSRMSVLHWHHPERMPPGCPVNTPVSLAIGVFDGVHRGHQALIDRAVAYAAADPTSLPMVLTFDPNPARFMRPDSYAGDLSTVGQRTALCAERGVRQALVVSFSEEFAALPGRPFLSLLQRLLPRLSTVVVGFNFHLGRGRDIHAREMAQWMAPHDIRVDIVSALKDNGESISSSRIRRAVAVGDLGQAAALLGRPYTVAIDGRLPSHRNESRQLLPEQGRYSCTFQDGGTNREGMMSVAPGGALTWEPHSETTQRVILRSKMNGIDS